MLRHFLKVAFRNLWKYKSQTFVSVIGLAVGFYGDDFMFEVTREELSRSQFVTLNKDRGFKE
jgi:hypothetical protein